MYLDLDEVTLYYEVKGEGEPLLLIHGVMVDAYLYHHASEILAKHYMVITFDRRGSSRSEAKGDIPYDMDAQISDVKALLDALEIEQTYICGASAGAVIGQYFMQCYPERVKKLLMFEPPILAMLKDHQDFQDWVAMMKDLIARNKMNKAIYEFVMSMGTMDDRAPEKPQEVSEREMNNMYHCLKNEYDVFIDYAPDIEKSRALSDRIIVAAGEKSGDGPYPTAAARYAQLIGAPLLHFPGCHNFPADLPTEFAICVMGTFKVM